MSVDAGCWKTQLLKRRLPPLRTQRFDYPDAFTVIVGKAYALDEATFVSYPDAAFESVADAVAHLFVLLEAPAVGILPTFLIDLAEDDPQVRRIRYRPGAIVIGQESPDSLPLVRLSDATLRALVADVQPLLT